MIRYIRKLSHSWPKWMLDMHLSNADFHDFIYYKKQAGIAFFGWAELLSAQANFRIDIQKSYV